jgi:hypothetical protein
MALYAQIIAQSHKKDNLDSFALTPLIPPDYYRGGRKKEGRTPLLDSAGRFSEQKDDITIA